ncbi:MAG: hypothetical protein AB1830_04625 [Pseudomonadota bacterium]
MATLQARSFAPAPSAASYRRRFPAFQVDGQGLEEIHHLAEEHGFSATWHQGDQRLSGPEALKASASPSLEGLTLELALAGTAAPAARLYFHGGYGIVEGTRDSRVLSFAAQVEALAAQRLPTYARCMHPLAWGYATLAFVLVTERPDLSRVGTEAAFLAWSGTILFGALMLLISTCYLRRSRELRLDPGPKRPTAWDRHGEWVLLFASGLVMGLSAVFIGQRLA